jgi:hypothetical protein
MHINREDSSRGKNTNSRLPDVKIYKFRSFVSNKTAKVSANETVPPKKDSLKQLPKQNTSYVEGY